MEQKIKMVNSALLIAGSILVSVHILILVIFIYSFFPVSAQLDLFKGYYITFHPNRQLFFYDLFLFLGMSFVIAGLKIFSRALIEEGFTRTVRRFLLMELSWVGLLFFLTFKMVVSEGSPLARDFFYGGLVLSFVSLFFGPLLSILKIRPQNRNIACLIFIFLLMGGCSALFEDQADLNLKDRVDYINQANSYIEAKNIPRAVVLLRQATQRFPLEPEAYSILGETFISLKDFQTARRYLSTAIRLDPDNPILQLKLAECFDNLGQKEKVIEALSVAVEIYHKRRDIENFKRVLVIYNQFTLSHQNKK